MASQGEEEAATRAALKRIAQAGSDLSRPLKMDFFVAVPDEASGRIVATRADSLGFETKLHLDEESQEWTCYCTKTLVATYERVRRVESRLNSLARDLGGYADGFGTFGNAEEEAN